MRLLYYCIVGDPLIYRVKGCVGETPFPQQTPPGRHPSHIQLITCLFLNSPVSFYISISSFAVNFSSSHLLSSLRSKLLIFSSSIFVPVVSSSSHRSKSSQLQILTPICFPSLKQTVYPLHETDHPRNPRLRPSLKESCDT
jgi:hypothetical protein